MTDLDILSRVLASESGDDKAALAIGLTVLTRYRGRPASHLEAGRHQLGAQHFSTFAAATPRSDRLAALAMAMFNQGQRFYDATTCFEYDVQLKWHRANPAKWRHPLALHARWISSGERLVKVYRGWVFYTSRKEST
jgi:hypothetical protein